MKLNIKNKNNSKKILTIALTVVVILVYGVFAWFNQLIPFARDRTDTPEPGKEVVNMERSDAEGEAIRNLKDNPDEKLNNGQSDQPKKPEVNSSTGKQSANVLITNAGVFNGRVSASGFVTNIVEDSGSCEYLFTKGTESLTKQSTVLANATSTTCSTVSFPVSELPRPGIWSVKLKYVSGASEGTSLPKEFSY